MPLPLYRLLEEYKREREHLINQIKGNTGLVYNKYFISWGDNWKIESGNKTGWIENIDKSPAGNRDLLAEATGRLIDLTDSLSGDFRCYKTLWRFATGLGLNHPIENGMVWHHTLGVPYLPGSSFKGLVRTWVEQWLQHSSQDDIDRIFGSQEIGDNDDRIGAGSIIFFDALPVAPVRLAADVMTPHYQKYYSGNEAPGDWQDPNPIPFLTIDEQQVFLFAVAPRKRKAPENQTHLEKVFQWVDQALENIGAGAKTATGYGRFNRCEQTENRLKSALIQRKEEQAEQVSSIPAHLTGPIAEEMIRDQYDADPEKFLNILKTKWLIKMHADDTSPSDQQRIAQLLKNWYQVHREGQWEKPNQKNAPIIEAIRKILGRK